MKEFPFRGIMKLGKGLLFTFLRQLLFTRPVAVQVLLKQMGYYHLWYGSEVICKAGVFQFEIVEVKEAEAYNRN